MISMALVSKVDLEPGERNLTESSEIPSDKNVGEAREARVSDIVKKGMFGPRQMQRGGGGTLISNSPFYCFFL
jgi:hypothetical protein